MFRRLSHISYNGRDVLTQGKRQISFGIWTCSDSIWMVYFSFFPFTSVNLSMGHSEIHNLPFFGNHRITSNNLLCRESIAFLVSPEPAEGSSKLKSPFPGLFK